MKTLKISKELWVKIMKDKLSQNAKTGEQVIWGLYKTITKMKREVKNGRATNN